MTISRLSRSEPYAVQLSFDEKDACVFELPSTSFSVQTSYFVMFSLEYLKRQTYGSYCCSAILDKDLAPTETLQFRQQYAQSSPVLKRPPKSPDYGTDSESMYFTFPLERSKAPYPLPVKARANGSDVGCYSGAQKRSYPRVTPRISVSWGIEHLEAGQWVSEKVVEMVEEGYRERQYWIQGVNSDPFFAGIRSDPRIVEIMKRIGLER